MRAAGMVVRKRAAYHCDREVWLPAFLRFRDDHTGNFLLHPKSRLCYISVRRGCDSRLFLVHENIFVSHIDFWCFMAL